ncbi:MAG: glycosyltransferase [Verrucomicrobiota bacterium]|nr:glycosyltransferase [Verrucomicrobiota bacterium]
MRVVMFYHTLVSDWNHGNAHFLRGIATELISRGHQVEIYEPSDSWSVQNLIAEHGLDPIQKFKTRYPHLRSTRYDLKAFDLNKALSNADLVIVHEWNDHDLVRRIGEHHRQHPSYRLFFHDTHHRMVTAPESMSAYDLQNYDGVLAYGKILQELYSETRRVKRAWTWHEAADVRVFQPLLREEKSGDLVWIGNWGDDERSAELQEFLIQPVKALGLKARVYGVRYPQHAIDALKEAGIEYCGWLPNFEVPEVFSQFRVTVHVPRRPYTRALPGIPTIRPFEALACGIPLISAPWRDAENLFRDGRDFLFVNSYEEMVAELKRVLSNPPLAENLIHSGLETLNTRHTCKHRVDELLAIDAELREEQEVTGGGDFFELPSTTNRNLR